MSHLRIYSDTHASTPLVDTASAHKIQHELARIGVRFEQWETPVALSATPSPEEVLAAYQADIQRLVAQEGYQSWDVISLQADHPQKDELRQKFLHEHRHAEDEVRFFVEGQGLFCLHIAQHIYQVLCVKGDLISVPANTPHWFDMRSQPNFTAIRLFNNPDGWIAHFTGSDIATLYPLLD